MLKRRLIIFVLLIFSACSVQPEIKLASRATLVHPFISTKKEVLLRLGKPQEIEKSGNKEIWFYFHKKTNFWIKVPGFKKLFGKGYTAVLKITFQGDQVIDCLYYTIPWRLQ